MKVFTSTEFSARLEQEEEEGIITPVTITVGGAGNPSAIKFNAKELNSGNGDTELFTSAVAANKLNKSINGESSVIAPINIDGGSKLSATTQVKNSIALNALSSLGVTFVKTPANILTLDETYKSDTADTPGFVSAKSVLGSNTLFTNESLLSASLGSRFESVTAETEIDFDAGALASSVLDSVINSTSTRHNTFSSPIKAINGSTKKVK